MTGLVLMGPRRAGWLWSAARASLPAKTGPHPCSPCVAYSPVTACPSREVLAATVTGALSLTLPTGHFAAQSFTPYHLVFSQEPSDGGPVSAWRWLSAERMLSPVHLEPLSILCLNTICFLEIFLGFFFFLPLVQKGQRATLLFETLMCVCMIVGT